MATNARSDDGLFAKIIMLEAVKMMETYDEEDEWNHLEMMKNLREEIETLKRRQAWTELSR